MIYKLNENFLPLGILENFESLIWDIKYYECGEFQLNAPYSLGDEAKYIYDNVQNEVGIIEYVEKEDINHIYKGRLLKGLLNNKVISTTCTYTNKTPEYIAIDLVKKFAGQNILVETSQNRGTPIDTLQVTGDNLMEYTDELLKTADLGAKIEYDYVENTLTYKIIEGVDNSEKFPMAKEFENIYSFKYTNSIADFKNFAYVDGENSAKKRVRVTVDIRTGNEEKRELYVDARDLQQEYTEDDGTQVTLTASEYKQALIQRGYEKLAEYQIQETVEIEPVNNYELGEIRTFRDGNLFTTQRLTEKLIAYEDNTTKQTNTFGLQQLTKIQQVKRGLS